LTPEEQAKMDRAPGRYKPETGTWTIKGNKISLDRMVYQPRSDTKQLRRSISYDGKNTRILMESSDGSLPGLVIPGRSHRFRTFFNPVLTLTAVGDKKLSAELGSYESELDKEFHMVGDVRCNLVRLYKKNNKGNIAESYKLYLDPERNYALVRTEKYYKNFMCLSSVNEVKKFTTINDILIPAEASCVTYNITETGKDSAPVSERTLLVTNTKLNQPGGIDDTDYDLKFPEGTKVWDERFKVRYKMKQ
jgi:hypothetical protein